MNYILLCTSLLLCIACNPFNSSADTNKTSDQQNTSDTMLIKTVAALSDLPICDASIVGRLFHLASTNEYMGCTSIGYESITIVGSVGAAGSPGDTGVAGIQGTAGPKGTTGSVGGTGVSGTNGQNGIDGTAGNNGSSHSIVPEGPLTVIINQDSTVTELHNGKTGITGNRGISFLSGIVSPSDSLGLDADTYLYIPYKAQYTKVSGAWVLQGYDDAHFFLDLRDNHFYPMASINGQVWMAENMAYLPQVHSKSNESTSEARMYVYGFSPTHTDSLTNITEAQATDEYRTHGVLYNWAAASDSACPNGWSLPDTAQWNALVEYASDDSTSAAHLKALYSWDNSYNNEKLDSYNFRAIASGKKTLSLFESKGEIAAWWTNDVEGVKAYNHYLIDYQDNTQSVLQDKHYGFSVRCIKE